MRTNARALASSTPSIPDKPADNGEARDERLEIWGGLGSPPEDGPTPEFRAELSRALDGERPQKSVEQLLQQLSDAQEGAEAALLYSSLGTLYANHDPPDVALVQETFDRALASAATDVQRVDVIYGMAQAYLKLGQTQRAIESLKGAPDGQEVVSRHAFELGVLEGMALERSGKLDGAQQSYSAVLKRLDDLGPEATRAMESVYRQAGLRLSRVYKKLGKKTEAGRVARQVRERLAY